MLKQIARPKILVALVALVAAQAASAAATIKFEDDSFSDAGFGAGSFDDFRGELKTEGSGRSNALYLEDLAPGVSWSSATLTFRSEANVSEDAVSGLTFGSSSGPTLSGTFMSKVHDGNAYLYTYQFEGPLSAGDNYVTVTGKAFALYGKEASVSLHAVSGVSAVPEPDSSAMAIAGLGALAFVARRRRR